MDGLDRDSSGDLASLVMECSVLRRSLLSREDVLDQNPPVYLASLKMQCSILRPFAVSREEDGNAYFGR